MTTAVAAPRYGAEDLDTASVRSAAPSYVSDTPSYHSTLQYASSAPAYAPRAGTESTSRPGVQNRNPIPQPRTIGLPPVPPAPPQNIVNLHNFRLPTWSANNAPAARHYRNVAERRITDGRYQAPDPTKRYGGANDRVLEKNHGASTRLCPNADDLRPLEDPSLVGEVAAAQARNERLARESGDDVLIREDRQWDWLLVQMKNQDEREKSWARFRRETDTSQRKKLLRRIGGRLLP